MTQGMYGTQYQWCQAPLEYRYALDVAAMWLWQEPHVALICNEKALETDILQRFPVQTKFSKAQTLLWIEPMHETWQSQAQAIFKQLSPGSTLVIMATSPLGRLIPERHDWAPNALGMSWRGLKQIKTEVRSHGFEISQAVGIHSLWAIVANIGGRLAASLGYEGCRDQCEVYARRWYVATEWLIPATITLIRTQRN